MAGFFHTPKPKGYRVEPRYWDQEKEKREARDRRIKAEMGIREEGENYRPILSKGDFKKGLSKGKWTVKTERRKSNTRLLALVVILTLLLYMMLR